MDIERLTKAQIVLLTLLVSFVTSIATGIVTVTLLDQAPPAITQTINRVVERTIERVVPDKSQGASVITKEVTIVVKEDDLITDSIEKNSDSIVRISKISDAEEESIENIFVGLGVIVSGDGMIATDSSIIFNDYLYSVTTADGSVFTVETVSNYADDPIALLFAISEDNADDAEEIKFSPIVFSNLDTLKIGQSVISLSGKERDNVAIGIISSLIEEEVVVEISVGDENTEEEIVEVEIETITILSFIKTDIDAENILPGSPVIDIFGEVIGIALGMQTQSNAEFKPVTVIKSTIANLSTDSEDSIESN